MCPIPLLQNAIPSQNRLLQKLRIAKYYEENPELNRLCAHAKLLGRKVQLPLPDPGDSITDFNGKRSDQKSLFKWQLLLFLEWKDCVVFGKKCS